MEHYPAESIPLAAHLEELRGRCEAASRLQGGPPYYQEELGYFLAYAEERHLVLENAPATLNRPPDDFGDRVEFLGALRSDGGLRLVIRQPAIAGLPATEQQISDFFVGNGWLPFRVEGELAYDPRHQLVISDTHPGNLVLMDDGLLAQSISVCNN